MNTENVKKKRLCLPSRNIKLKENPQKDPMHRRKVVGTPGAEGRGDLLRQKLDPALVQETPPQEAGSLAVLCNGNQEP